MLWPTNGHVPSVRNWSPTNGLCLSSQTITFLLLVDNLSVVLGISPCYISQDKKILLGKRYGHTCQDIFERGFMGNSCRKYTSLFRYPENRRYNVWLLPNFRTSDIWDWYRSAYAWFLLHSNSKTGKFSEFHDEEASKVFSDRHDDGDRFQAVEISGGNHNYRADCENEEENWKKYCFWYSFGGNCLSRQRLTPSMNDSTMFILECQHFIYG